MIRTIDKELEEEGFFWFLERVKGGGLNSSSWVISLVVSRMEGRWGLMEERSFGGREWEQRVGAGRGSGRLKV